MVTQWDDPAFLMDQAPTGLPMRIMEAAHVPFGLPMIARRRLRLVGGPIGGHDPRYPRLEWVDVDHEANWTAMDLPSVADIFRCATRFLRLEHASDEDILAFAAEWGVLNIQSDGQPDSRRRRVERLTDDTVRDSGKVYWEPLSAWRRLSHHYRLALGIFADLEAGKLMSESDYLGMMIDRWDWGDPSVKDRARLTRHAKKIRTAFNNEPEEAVAFHRFLFASELNRSWLEWGDLGVTAFWNRSAVRGLAVEARSMEALPAALAFQMASAFASPSGVHRCDRCDIPFFPSKRRPRKGAATFCQVCQQGEARLASKQKWWRDVGRHQRAERSGSGKKKENVDGQADRSAPPARDHGLITD